MTLLLRWIPPAGVAGPVRQAQVYTRGLDVDVTSFFGLTRGQAMTGGFFGLLFGAGLCLIALVMAPTRLKPVAHLETPNIELAIEPAPGLSFTAEERILLQTIFRRYARLVLEMEFLSGYSGARTFLARPIREDGRADAYTIVKIGQRRDIEAEFENYETFVKDTLPPITARIQHPPVIAAQPSSSPRVTAGGAIPRLLSAVSGLHFSTPSSPSRAHARQPAPGAAEGPRPCAPVQAVRHLRPELVDAAPPVHLPPGAGVRPRAAHPFRHRAVLRPRRSRRRQRLARRSWI